MTDQQHQFEQAFRREFHDLLPNMIYQQDDGSYQVFGHYRIQREQLGYRLFCGATDIGVFGSTRSALSWCIADKNQAYNRAREIAQTDLQLTQIKNDIAVRAAMGDRSRNPQFKEQVWTKLETKIIHKKILENRLAKCVNWAKYIQQRGFDNETQRIGRNQPNKTSR